MLDRGPTVLSIASLLFAAVLLLALVGRPLATDDLWWHLKLGEAYSSEGLWPAEDPMLHTAAPHAPVQHEWLFQVALHRLQSWIGFHGLRAVHAIGVGALLALAYSIFRRASTARAPAALATLVFIALSWYRLFQLRPDLFSIFATLLLYVLVLEREAAPSRRKVAAATALLLVWANAHSLFAIGLALLFAALLGLALQSTLRGAISAARSDPIRARRLALALAAGLLVTLVNPRGIDQHLTFVIESEAGSIWHLQDDFLHFDPFRPAQGNRALGFLAWLLMDALLAGFLLTAGHAGVQFLRRRSPQSLAAIDPVHLGLGMASTLAILVAIRFHWLSIFPLLYLLRAVRRRAEAREKPDRVLAWMIAAASLAVAFFFPVANKFGTYAREVSVEPDGYWRSAYLDRRYAGPGTRFLRDADLEGNLFNPFNLGGFLGYWLAPRLRTYIDGRLDHYPPEVMDDYQTIYRGSREGPPTMLRELLDKRHIDIFFGVSFPQEEYENLSSITQLRRLPEWTLIFPSDTHSIYLRKGPRNRANLARVEAYYRRRGLPYRGPRGVNVAAIVRDRPDWALEQHLLPPTYARLQRQRHAEDPEERSRALETLGDIFWRIGDFEDQVEVDQELAGLRPEAKEVRRRLADGLLHLGRNADALRVAKRLYDEDPRYSDIQAIYSIARNRAKASAKPQPSRSSR